MYVWQSVDATFEKVSVAKTTDTKILKLYYKISWRETVSMLRISNLVMIVIHMDILMQPLKDVAERGVVFSK